MKKEAEMTLGEERGRILGEGEGWEGRSVPYCPRRTIGTPGPRNSFRWSSRQLRSWLPESAGRAGLRGQSAVLVLSPPPDRTGESRNSFPGRDSFSRILTVKEITSIGQELEQVFCQRRSNSFCRRLGFTNEQKIHERTRKMNEQDL